MAYWPWYICKTSSRCLSNWNCSAADVLKMVLIVTQVWALPQMPSAGNLQYETAYSVNNMGFINAWYFSRTEHPHASVCTNISKVAIKKLNLGASLKVVKLYPCCICVLLRKLKAL